MWRRTSDLIKLLGGYRRWLLLLALSVTRAALEALSAAAVFMLLNVILEPDSESSVPIIGDIWQALPGSTSQEQSLALVGVVAVFFILHGLGSLADVYAQQRAAFLASAALAERLYEGYLRQPYLFYIKTDTARLIRNTHDATLQLARNLFLPIVRIFAETLLLLALLVVLIVAAPLATILVVCMLGPLVLIVLRGIHPRLRRWGASAHSLSRMSIAALQQTFRAIKDIHIYATVPYFVSQFHSLRQQLARDHYLQGTAAQIPRSVFYTALMLFILGFFAVSVSIGQSNATVLSTLGLFAYAGLRIQPALNTIAKDLNGLKFSGPVFDDVVGDLENFAQSPTSTSSDRTARFKESVEFRNVSLQHSGASVPSVDHVNLVINKGSIVGICGSSGAGKTTLVDLLCGILTPTDGDLYVDGENVQDILKEWQRNIGFVAQDPALLNDTVMRNIAFGVPDDCIDEDAVWEAVGIAQLDVLIKSLPAGIDSAVGENGVRLSVGQRQRIAVARALYRKPDLLVMDEGTSALDNLTESKLIREIESSRSDRTVVMVAHRLTTVKNSDLVVFMNRGRIQAMGSYDEMYENDLEFQELVRAGDVLA